MYGKHLFFTDCCLDLPHPSLSFRRDDGEPESVAQCCLHITARPHLTKLLEILYNQIGSVHYNYQRVL